MSNDNASFLNLNGMTVEFSPRENPPFATMVKLTYQCSTDPNEEMGEEVMTAREARDVWRNMVKKGAKRAQGWHATGRCRYED